MQNGTYPQLVAELARISGRDVAFSPTKPDTKFNLDYKRAVLRNVLSLLYERGAVQIAGQDFEKLTRLRRRLVGGEKISLCVRNNPRQHFRK